MNEVRYRDRSPIHQEAFVLIFFLLIIAAFVISHITIFGIIFLAADVIFSSWLLFNIEKTKGAWVSDEGVKTKFLFVCYKWEWKDIREFSFKKQRVYVVLKSGSKSPLVGVIQNKRVTWEGGESYDVVGVLNKRLQEYNSKI